jgi:hypothetical protein
VIFGSGVENQFFARESEFFSSLLGQSHPHTGLWNTYGLPVRDPPLEAMVYHEQGGKKGQRVEATLLSRGSAQG